MKQHFLHIAFKAPLHRAPSFGKNLFLKILFFLAFFSAAVDGSAQEIIDGHIVYNYTMRDGLPSNQILYSMQDRNGYMWFATGGGGVSRFDGKNFKTYDLNNGLTDSDVFTINEDHKGRLWFGTFNHKICYLENDSIHEFEFNDSLQSHLSSKAIISRLYFDELGSLFIFFLNAPMLEVTSAGEIISAKQATKELGVHINSFKDSQEAFVSSSYQEPHLDLLELTVKLYEGGSGSIEKYNTPIILQGTGTFRGSHLVRTDTNAMLLFANNQLFKIDRTSARPLLELKMDSKLSKSRVVNLFNREGVIWILLENEGVVRCRVENDTLKLIDHIIKNEFITHIHEDGLGGLWLSTHNRGLLYMPYPEITSVKKEMNWQVHRKNLIVYDDENMAYALGPNTVLIEQEGKTDTLHVNSEYGNFVTDMLFTSSADNLYVLCNRSLSFFDLKDDTSRYVHLQNGLRVYGNDLMLNDFGELITVNKLRISFTNPESQEAINHFDINFRAWAVTQLGDKLLIGSNTGLYEYYRIDDEWVESTSNSFHPINKSFVVDFENYKDGAWVASTGRGIGFFKDSIEYSIGLEEGLSSLNVSSLNQDGDTLWASTDNGLNKIVLNPNGRVHKIDVYTQSNGLSSNQVVGAELSRNYIYVSTSVGFDKIPRSTFIVGNDNLTLDLQGMSLKSDNMNFSAELKQVTYEENDLAFAFSSIDFFSLGAPTYRYKLTPYDDDWNITSDEVAEYNNLIPDDYRFQVQIKDRFGNWVSQEEYQFSIQAALWNRSWFRLLALGVIILGLIYRVRLREKRLKEKLELKTQVDSLREKALRAQVNPHFLFNTLNSIQLFILDGDFEASNKYLSKFSKLIRLILNQSERQEISLNEEVTILTTYLDLEKMRFEDQFDYTISLDEELNAERLVIPSMLIQPYLENAIWHGLVDKTIQGEINIDFLKEDAGPEPILKCIVTDNGIGRVASRQMKATDSTQRKAFGMTLTERRLNVIGGAQANRVVIEDMYADDGQASGTRIILALPYLLRDK